LFSVRATENRNFPITACQHLFETKAAAGGGEPASDPEPEVIELFKKVSVPVRFRSTEVPSRCMLILIGSYLVALSNLGNSGTGEAFVPSIYQFPH